MNASFKPQMSEKPDLVSVDDLPGEWISDYLNQGAASRGEGISSWACEYPAEKPQLRFVFSGAQRERVTLHLAEVKVGSNVTSGRFVEEQASVPSDSPAASGVEGTEAEADARGSDDESLQADNAQVLPDLEVPLDPSDENYEDAYYESLLLAHPERILVTMEYLNPDQESNENVVVNYTIDPPIDAGIVQHYRAKFQTGVIAGVSASKGSVTLRMWRWFRDDDNRVRQESIDSQQSVAGVESAQPPLRHSGFPVMSSYDVNVIGDTDGSEYEISGSWLLEL